MANVLQTSQDSTEDSKVDTGNQKKNEHFADLVKEAESDAGFSASHQFHVGQNDIT